MQVPIELKLNYLKRRIHDLKKLAVALEQDDFSMALKLGHQVKGNAVTFDFPQMAFIGVEMENAAKQKDKERIRFLAKKMEKEICNAKVKISDHKGPGSLALRAI